MMKRGRRAALAAVLALVLALNGGAIAVAAEESQDGEVPAVLQVKSKELMILDPFEAPDVPASLKMVTVMVDDQRTGGWTVDGDGQQEFVIFYGRMEDGEPGYYQYDLVEKTIQRYTAANQDGQKDDLALLMKEYNQLVEDYDELSRENLMLKIVTAAAVLAAII